MADKSFTRRISTGTVPKELRLPPYPKFPEKVVRAFPELRAHEAEVSEWQRKTSEQIRLAFSEMNQDGSDYVAIFEENL